MKKNYNLNISLPSIKPILKIYPHKTERWEDDLNDSQSDRLQVSVLDQWTCRNDCPPRKKCSKLISALYRDSTNRIQRKRGSVQSSIVMQAKLYLVRLQSELKKVNDIDYLSIFKNIQYCSEMYFNFYSLILRTLHKIRNALSKRYGELEDDVKKQRLIHIKSMEKLLDKDHYRDKIPIVRGLIELKEKQLQPLKNIIQNIDSARITVLKHSLSSGYDVREDGIIWILRELDHIPHKQQYPTFLNQKEIEFINSRFRRQTENRGKQLELIQESHLATHGKTNQEIIQIVTRKKKRELSIIKEGDVLQELTALYRGNFSSDKHKYLDQSILRMAQNQLPKTKATKYEVIYKQTRKKLNKICINQIYKKNNINKRRDAIEHKRDSTNTIKILSHFQSKIGDYLNRNTTGTTVNQDERQLDEIIRNLRYQSYQQTNKSQLRSRNPVSILGCLVGWKKAKRIIEQQMSYVF